MFDMAGGVTTTGDDGVVATLGEGTIGGVVVETKSNKKLRKEGDCVSSLPRGKTISSNTIWREVMMRREESSKHRYSLWLVGYSRKTQGVKQGACL